MSYSLVTIILINNKTSTFYVITKFCYVETAVLTNLFFKKEWIQKVFFFWTNFLHKKYTPLNNMSDIWQIRSSRLEVFYKKAWGLLFY